MKSLKISFQPLGIDFDDFISNEDDWIGLAIDLVWDFIIESVLFEAHLDLSVVFAFKEDFFYSIGLLFFILALALFQLLANYLYFLFGQSFNTLSIFYYLLYLLSSFFNVFLNCCFYSFRFTNSLTFLNNLYFLLFFLLFFANRYFIFLIYVWSWTLLCIYYIILSFY
jgi:hypothetical protein